MLMLALVACPRDKTDNPVSPQGGFAPDNVAGKTFSVQGDFGLGTLYLKRESFSVQLSEEIGVTQNHSKKEWVRYEPGYKLHTNKIENFGDI